jgi:hypothetical protein
MVSMRVAEKLDWKGLRQSAHEGGKVVSRTHRLPLPSGDISGTHFC